MYVNLIYLVKYIMSRCTSMPNMPNMNFECACINLQVMVWALGCKCIFGHWYNDSQDKISMYFSSYS